MDGNDRKETAFPVSAGILLGLGIGGFFDGILLHQVRFTRWIRAISGLAALRSRGRISG